VSNPRALLIPPASFSASQRRGEINAEKGEKYEGIRLSDKKFWFFENLQ